jgi:hypothetical protein
VPKFNVKFLCRFTPGCVGGKPIEQERSENLYAADAADAERKARAWWDVVEFHGAKPFEAAPKAPPAKVSKKQIKEAEF